jgi:hypothetical protein
MYTRAQKESSSVSPTSTHKKSNGSDGSRSFSVQRQPEINSSVEQEIPSYSRNAADSLAANVMRSMEAREQGEEAQEHKGQEESGAASVAQVVMPKPELAIAPAMSVSQPLGNMGIQRQCSECEQGMEFGKDSDEMSSVAGVQTKLTVGTVGDKYEQEADQVAAQVMSMPVAPDHSPQVQRFGEEDNPVQRWSLAQSITPVVQRQVDEPVQMRSLVQRAFQAGGNEASGDLEGRLNASKGGGSALAPEVRAFMEPRFGADFSSVRVHTGGEAVQMNRELGAQAFAHGSDVYFGAGKSPGNNELTAHELTHVVQQNVGNQNAAQKIMPYRASTTTHFNAEQEGDLKEETFNQKKDKETKPWIEKIIIHFYMAKRDQDANLMPIGIATASYYKNKLPTLRIGVGGGSKELGITVSNASIGLKEFTVGRIEGAGYNDEQLDDKNGEGMNAFGTKNKYVKKDKDNDYKSSMSYATYFYKNAALHRGGFNDSSHGCVHAGWNEVGYTENIKQINYHSVKGLTKVIVEYEPGLEKSINTGTDSNPAKTQSIKDYEKAISHSPKNYEIAVELLLSFPEKEREVILMTTQEQDKRYMYNVVKRKGLDKLDTLGNQTRSAYLNISYQDALKQTPKNWQMAAEYLNGFNKEDIQTRLIRLTAQERQLLHEGAVKNPKVGAAAQIAQMTKP